MNAMATPASVLQVEPIAGMLESGLERMVRAHWREVAHDQDVIALDPDWDHYRAQERDGAFVGMSLRRNGELIGYNGFFLHRHPHYKTNLFALNDVIYLDPRHRGPEGLRLILGAERELAARGAIKVFYHTKTDALLGEEGDSLSTIEGVLDVEAEYGVRVSDDLLVGNRTLGEVLHILGYGHAENTFGKLLRRE